MSFRLSQGWHARALTKFRMIASRLQGTGVIASLWRDKASVTHMHGSCEVGLLLYDDDEYS